MDKDKGGRPSGYSDELHSKVEDYILNFEQYGHVVPSVVGLTKVLGITSSMVYRWSDKHADFKTTISVLKDIQHFELINSGLKGVFNPAITKLMLSNHGYSEKPKDVAVAAPVPITVVIKRDDGVEDVS